MVDKPFRRSVDLVNSINKKIIKNQLIIGRDRILVSISGGQDSICLLLLLNQLYAQMELHLALFWCQHLWQMDSFSLMRQITKLSFLFQFNGSFAITSRFVPSELLARNWRHSCSHRVCLFYNYSKISLAHSANDKVETILLNLMRGTGITGLSSLYWAKTVPEKLIQKEEHMSQLLPFPFSSFSWSHLKTWIFDEPSAVRSKQASSGLAYFVQLKHYGPYEVDSYGMVCSRGTTSPYGNDENFFAVVTNGLTKNLKDNQQPLPNVLIFFWGGIMYKSQVFKWKERVNNDSQKNCYRNFCQNTKVTTRRIRHKIAYIVCNLVAQEIITVSRSNLLLTSVGLVNQLNQTKEGVCYTCIICFVGTASPKPLHLLGCFCTLQKNFALKKNQAITAASQTSIKNSTFTQNFSRPIASSILQNNLIGNFFVTSEHLQYVFFVFPMDVFNKSLVKNSIFISCSVPKVSTLWILEKILLKKRKKYLKLSVSLNIQKNRKNRSTKWFYFVSYAFFKTCLIK